MMTTHSYTLRSRVSNSSLSSRTGSQSPLQKSIRSPRKGSSSTSNLQLKHVIGSTTTAPSGLSCCEANASYAYTAGSIAVLASIDHNDVVSYRYFKARPLAAPVNPIVSFYDSRSTSHTPTRRRTTFNISKSRDEIGVGFIKDWSDDSAGQTWSARERIKTAACVSISPDGKILAVGETGYNPRVLLFSTAKNAPSDTPMSIITDHTVGICSVAFSPNSKYLATLGDMNDGFLYIWQVNTKTGAVKLHSSNKCTTNINDMTWVGDSVVTVGTRHIKIWQIAVGGTGASARRARVKNDSEVFSSSPIPLQGRNCILGTFVDATFTSIVATPHDQAIVCTDNGNMCVLHVGRAKVELTSVKKADVYVSAVSHTRDAVVWAASGGLIEERNLQTWRSNVGDGQKTGKSRAEEMEEQTPQKSSLNQSLGLGAPKRPSIVALGCLGEKAVSIDADGTVRVFKIDAGDSDSDICRVSSHTGSVNGIQKLPEGAGIGSFFTWAKNGELRCWNTSGELLRAEKLELHESLPVEDTTGNEIKVVRYLQVCNAFISGDQFGTLKLIDCSSWRCLQSVRAHSAEITCIDIHESQSLVATCSRDRTIQIFVARAVELELELLQTCDDHISSVNQVLFSHDGNQLLSASADRTVVIRERVERSLQHNTISAFIPTRTVTLKSAPLSMSILQLQPSTLVLSTMDRHITKVNLATGATIGTFKVADPDSEDCVFLNSICIGRPNLREDKTLLVGYSSVDKSIRVYDLDRGILLNRDAGHTEGISDLLMFEDTTAQAAMSSTMIVSTGLDSTMMMWSVTSGNPLTLTPQQELPQSPMSVDNDPEKPPRTANATPLPPLRKILSKADFVDLARQTSPTRERSPNGLHRRTSRLALTSSIEETDETLVLPKTKARSHERETTTERLSPPPPPPSELAMRPKRQRSQPELKGSSTQASSLEQSLPFQNQSVSISIPFTTNCKYNTRANNSRLRRPPSVPTDLRAQSAIDERRFSVSGISDSGGMIMATEQACRTLKSYGKRLQASKGELDLDEIEADVEALLKTIRNRKARLAGDTNSQTNAMKHINNDVIHELTIQLERTKV